MSSDITNPDIQNLVDTINQVNEDKIDAALGTAQDKAAAQVAQGMP